MTLRHVDTHTHLQDARLKPILPEVLARAQASGVAYLVSCGTRPSDWAATLDLAARHAFILPMLGLHPWYVAEADPDWLSRLAQQVQEKTVGIGECGLDFAVADADREAQEQAFRAQLHLARDCHRPISIHCRKAWERLEAILADTGLPAAGAVVHSFSGSAESALRLQRLGLHLSFSCSLANPNNPRAAKAVKAVSLDRLLFETDAPDIPPRHLPGWVEGTLNEPMHIGVAVQAAARLRGQSEEAVAEQAFRNACEVFRPLLPGDPRSDRV